jgi:pSer/pThr/pTyr-binding forkhead associated (FHA) protein
MDLGSTNGTIYDGSKIEGLVELSDKSEFQVGATTLMLIVTDDHS